MPAGQEACALARGAVKFNAPEQRVVLENNPKRWGALNEQQRQHAINYVEEIGGFR